MLALNISITSFADMGYLGKRYALRRNKISGYLRVGKLGIYERKAPAAFFTFLYGNNCPAGENMKNFIIRTAQKGDIAKLAEFFGKAQRLMCEMSPAGFGEALCEPGNRQKEEKRLLEELKDKNQITFVAEPGNGGLAGFITGCIEKYSDDLLTAPFVTVQYIYIDKKYRRHGIAGAFIEKLDWWTRNKKIRTMELTVWSGNTKAKALFKNSGYLSLQNRMAKKLR